MEIPILEESLIDFYSDNINQRPIIKKILWTMVLAEGDRNTELNKKTIVEKSGFSQKVIDNSISYLEGALMLKHIGVGTHNFYYLTNNGKEVIKKIKKKGGFNNESV